MLVRLLLLLHPWASVLKHRQCCAQSHWTVLHFGVKHRENGSGVEETFEGKARDEISMEV